jgi:hypothetical protein
MLGTMNGHKLAWVEAEPKHGHSYAVWR